MKLVAFVAAVILCAMTGAQTGQKAQPVDLKLSLGRPVQIGTLAVVPIESTIPLAKETYLTLAQATKMGVVEIVEVPGQEQVNTLEVRNKGKLPILLFAGELLLGGKQDRIVAKDSIVPGNERRDVPVFCVEHGRWNGKAEFQSGDTFVNDEVRFVAYDKSDQSVVWSTVAKTNQQVSASPSTGTIRGQLDDPKVRAATNKLYTDLDGRFVPTSRTVGVICWIDGKILSADIFANPALFNASRSKLFRSYATDVQLAKSPKAVPVDVRACQVFLNQIVNARREISDRSRERNIYTIKDGKVQGYESGNGLFRGGAPGGGGFGGGGFGHGTYKPGK